MEDEAAGYQDDEFEDETPVTSPTAPSGKQGLPSVGIGKADEKEDGYHDAFEDDFEEDADDAKDDSKAYDETFEDEEDVSGSPDSPVSSLPKVQGSLFNEDKFDDSISLEGTNEDSMSPSRARFEEDGSPTDSPQRREPRKAAGFVKLGALPPEDEEEDEERKLRFEGAEDGQDGAELPSQGIERPEKRQGTGFVKLGELPPEDQKVRFEDPESPTPKQQRSPEGGFFRNGIQLYADPEDQGEGQEREEDEKKLRFEDPELPEAKKERSPKGKATGFVEAGMLRPGGEQEEEASPDEDDEEEDDEESSQDDLEQPVPVKQGALLRNESTVRFEEPEVKARERRPSIVRQATGFAKPGALSSEDGEAKLRFEEPEVKPRERRPSIVRQATGFAKPGALPSEDEPGAGNEPKLRFEEPEVKPRERRPSIVRQATGFVKPDALPSADEDEECKPRFEALADEGEPSPARSETSQNRKATGLVKRDRLSLENLELDDSVDDPAQDTAGSDKSRCVALNAGEEGEEDDPDDDDLQSLMQRSNSASGIVKGLDETSLMLQSLSAPSLSGSLAVARRRKIPSHLPPKGKAPARPPPGCSSRKLPPPLQAWEERHHLSGGENEKLPKRLRLYFERPQTLPELKTDLEKRSNMNAMLRAMEQPEVPFTRPTPITCDSGPPVIPSKHVVGGTMKDRDNEVRPWHGRFSQGIGCLNDAIHPLHREYFSQPSLFADAPSQRWRRYMDIEVKQSEWKPIQGNRPPRFPPIGV